MCYVLSFYAMAKIDKETRERLDKLEKETEGQFDEDGICWNEREFSHPERTIRIATSFSGIGAPEQALKRLGLKTKIVFACDMGERYLKYNFKKLRELTANLSDDEKKKFAEYLYEGNKEKIAAQNKKRAETGEPIVEFTEDIVFYNLYEAEKPAYIKIEITKDCLDLILKKLPEEERIPYLNQLYDKEGINYIKESFFANYDIDEENWHNDIRFLDATPYKGQVDIYIGGSPCQAFSMAGKRLTLKDTRGKLFGDFAARIKECQPKVFIFENVLGMKTVPEDEELVSGLQAALDLFSNLGYTIYWKILNAKDYGIPQNRERIWVVGFKEETDFKFPKAIPLTKRMYDFLDEDIPPRSGHVDQPYLRQLTGMECLRLMGFFDFKVAPIIEELGKKETKINQKEKELQRQAGNSMVVDCLIALFRQMDITKYGVELD